MDFDTGPYGEIYPQALTTDADPDESLRQLADASAGLGSSIEMPTKGRSLDGMYALAMLYEHQLRLRKALAGRLDELPEAAALRQAVMEERRPMSLRPLTLEHLEYHCFAPVLRYLGNERWQVGIKNLGWETIFEEGDPEQAVARAQQLFCEWAERDEVQWLNAAQKILARCGRSLFHEYWAWRLRQDETWERGGGYFLALLGKHNTFMLETPKGSRILSMERVKAVHLCDALARRAGVAPPYPTATEVLQWLSAKGLPTPQVQDDTRWTINDVQVQVQRARDAIAMAAVNRTYLILRSKRPPELALHPVNQHGHPDRSKAIARTAWEKPFGDWMQSIIGRTALAGWFVYHLVATG